MKNDEQTIHISFNSDLMFAMSNLRPSRTGLKYQVWYSAMVANHAPTVKVDLGEADGISIQIPDLEIIGATDKISPSDLNDILKWIDLNKELLLKYWYEAPRGLMDSLDVCNKLKKLE